MSGTVFPNARQIDATWGAGLDPDKTVKLERMISQAIALGGACTKKFNQADPRTAKPKPGTRSGQGFLALSRGKGIPGVCYALSIAWIAYHADGKDFWGWLYEPDPNEPDHGYDRLNRPTAERLVNLQLIINAMNQWQIIDGKWVDPMERYADEFMRSMGVGKMSFGGIKWTEIRTLPFAVARDVASDRYSAIDSYKLLRFQGRRNPAGKVATHVCAAWVGNDVTYFDCNYGEFWFPTRSAFRQWFFHYWFASFYPEQCGNYYMISAYSPLYVRR